MSRKYFWTAIKALSLCLSVAVGMNVDAAERSSSNPWNASGGPGLRELAAAADHNRFAYLLFWRNEDDTTQRMNAALQEAKATLKSPISLVSVSVDDVSQQELVEQFGADRAPLPLVIAIAPNGAVTQAWVADATAAQLQAGIVSQGTAACLKAMQEQKLSLISVCNADAANREGALQAAKQFQADERFAAAVELINIDPTDEREREFLANLKVSPDQRDVVTLLVSPAGQMIGSFPGQVTAEQLVAQIEAAQQSCCPGGQCGPEGCCPDGQCPPSQN
ncbi:MAG: hypothetical protein ACIALR_04755 [Blastopirellula sp. JB062]